MEPDRAVGVWTGAAQGIEAGIEAEAAARGVGAGAPAEIGAARVDVGATAGVGAADVEAAAATWAGSVSVRGSVSRVRASTDTREGGRVPAGAAVVEAEARAAVVGTEEGATRRVRARVEAGTEARLVTGIGDVMRVAGPWEGGAAREAELMQSRALTTARLWPESFYRFHNRISSCNSRVEVQNLLRTKVIERAMEIEIKVARETNSPDDYKKLSASFLLYIDNFTLPSPLNTPREGHDVHGQMPNATAATLAVPRPLSLAQPRHPLPPTVVSRHASISMPAAPRPLPPHPIRPPVVIVRSVAQRALPPPRQPSPDVLMPPPPPRPSPPLGADVDVDVTLRLRPPAPYDPQDPSNSDPKV